MSKFFFNRNPHQVNSPDRITTDHRGSDIIVGKKVAYNYSGRVAIGTIISYDKCDWYAGRRGVDDKSWWGLNFKLTVRGEDGIVSFIKNPNSYIII